MKKTKKRPRDRPRSDRARIQLAVLPEMKAAIKRRAQALGIREELTQGRHENWVTDFNDVARQNPDLISRQLEEAIREGKERSPTPAIEHIARTV